MLRIQANKESSNKGVLIQFILQVLQIHQHPLSDDYEAKISDFGLAKLMPEGQETNVTQGYFGPFCCFFLGGRCGNSAFHVRLGLLLFISAGSVPRVYLHQVVVVVAVFPPRLLSAKV
ncbi:hypothetical protein LXL04_022241 [Taraxacum kok-saghyz]